jgi:crossover junction endodeoxyribonuclease RuvC
VERIILGIDPGTTVMGYGILKVENKKAYFVDLGIVNMRNIKNHYLSLKKIFEEVTLLIEKYLPDELAIEAPFFEKNVQSMLKLGRAQGVAITAAITHDIPISEYAPLKIKMAITGQGRASKEQVADMLCRILKIPHEILPKELDATDGLAAAYCHFLQTNSVVPAAKYKNWKDFINKNQEKVKK